MSSLSLAVIDTDGRVEPRDGLLSFSAYFLSGLSLKSLSNLLVNPKAANQQEYVMIASVSNVETNKEIEDGARLNLKRKAVELCDERSEDSSVDRSCKGKKPRVTWTKEMHQKFLDAIAIIGHEKAVPKKIVEVMGVPGLTRENVASHLQKYRCYVKQTENNPSQHPCTSTRTGLRDLCVLTSFDSRPDTRIRGSHYSDVRNMMQQLRAKHASSSSYNNNNSNTSKFVGYRFIGNQIDYGSMNKISNLSSAGRLQAQSTSYVKFDPSAVVQQPPHPAPDLLSSYAPKTGSLPQGPPTQQGGACSGSLLDQLQPWDASAFHDEEFPLLAVEEPGNGLFLDEILQQHCSPVVAPPPLSAEVFQDLEDILEHGGNADYLIDGVGNTYDQFDIQEFDDTFFSQERDD